jgi:riboflavin biosynthesis pyrimidine reductase
MQDSVLELYPAAGQRRALKNLYLRQLETLPADAARPFIYSNFIASLDGRIALPGAGRHTHQVPPAIANPRDWRLFQELAAQADLLITSARYFRQAADAETQAELPVGLADDFADLRDWRRDNGLKPQPDVAIFSASLDIPSASLDHYRERRLYVVTGRQADPARLEELSNRDHVEIIQCGDGKRVDAGSLRARLAQLGYRRVYAIAGPSVFHTLVSANAMDRLYHTTAHCLLGGTEFDTFVWGDEFRSAFALPLRNLYLDSDSPAGCGQTLAVYGNY